MHPGVGLDGEGGDDGLGGGEGGQAAKVGGVEERLRDIRVSVEELSQLCEHDQLTMDKMEL